MRNAEPTPAVPPADITVPVICRPGKAAAVWMILPGIMAFYCGLFIVLGLLTGPGNRIVTICLASSCALFLLGLIPGIVWARRGAIIADEAGLRWRGLGAWKFASWGEVRDYYERLSPQNRGSLTSYRAVETVAGRLNVTSQWTNADALWACVELRATASAAREWGRSRYTPL